MWEQYSKFSSVLDKVASKWCTNLAGRYSFEELRSECVEAYTSAASSKLNILSDADFSRYLWRTCTNAILSMLRKRRIWVDVADLPIKGSAREFRELMLKFCKEYAQESLPSEAMEILSVVLDRPDVLEEFHKLRIKDSPYETSYSREDLSQYFTSVRGWNYGVFTRAFNVLRKYVQLVYFSEMDYQV